MFSRQDYQSIEAQFLAPYAALSATTLGRKHPEKEHLMRTPFQRDRDRIIHSTAFRRLQYKTQVFVNHEGDHYRTRLTHTIETCQIARSVARALRLNEDLVEAIGSAHDIGHGPFGHAGEWTLKDIMADYGGFEHNAQSLRIVELLEERYPDFSGLNLTLETLSGINKHPERAYASGAERVKTFEADVVDVADEIAYNSHDLDDGLRSGLLEDEQLMEVDLWHDCAVKIRKKFPQMTCENKRRLAIRMMIDLLVADLVTASDLRIHQKRIRNLRDIQKNKSLIIGFSDKIRKSQGGLKKFLRQNLYTHHYVVRMTQKGQRLIRRLFEGYLENPLQLPPDIQRHIKKNGLQRTICDYIAGMTDRFAMDEYRRMFEPYE